MALLLRGIQIAAQHGVDHDRERSQPRRHSHRGLARRAAPRRPTPDAPCADAPRAYRPTPESRSPRPDDHAESPRTTPPSTSARPAPPLTGSPEHPDTNHAGGGAKSSRHNHRGVSCNWGQIRPSQHHSTAHPVGPEQAVLLGPIQTVMATWPGFDLIFLLALVRTDGAKDSLTRFGESHRSPPFGSFKELHAQSLFRSGWIR